MRPGAILGQLFLALALVGPAAAAPRPCAEPNVVVSATDPGDFETGCDGAAAAAEFLAASGLQTRIPIEIAFVDVMPDAVAGAPAVGCYIWTDERIYVLTYARCRTMTMSHGVAIDRAVQQGLVAHEVAHRIVLAHASPRPLGVLAVEYIAYVAMYSAMPAAQREHVLRQIPGNGFGSEAEINMTIYLIDPGYFGAQSYRHFMKPDAGRPFIARILDRKALVDDESR